MQFRNEYEFLSNFHRSKCEYHGMEFKCVEAAFQAAKCANQEDAKKFLTLDGKDAKRLGRQIKMRDDWDTYRLTAMKEILQSKFQNPDLAQKLIDTGDIEIQEENTWNDTFWGICGGNGQNHLGKLLMEVREEIKEKQLTTPKTETFSVLIAGSRNYNDYPEMKKVMDHLLSKVKHTHHIQIVSGGARGADALAEQYASDSDFDIKVMKAEWDRYGKSAGYKRNAEMHKEIQKSEKYAVVCFWDGESKGTAHNFQLCEQSGTPLKIYNYVQKQFVNPPQKQEEIQEQKTDDYVP